MGMFNDRNNESLYTFGLWRLRFMTRKKPALRHMGTMYRFSMYNTHPVKNILLYMFQSNDIVLLCTCASIEKSKNEKSSSMVGHIQYPLIKFECTVTYFQLFHQSKFDLLVLDNSKIWTHSNHRSVTTAKQMQQTVSWKFEIDVSCYLNYKYAACIPVHMCVQMWITWFLHF